tara:strand:- start:1380 stop:1550 length:171 start_codon:yes stop_codon:yes gene_type:complete
MNDTIKLKKGDKVIERHIDEYNNNKTAWINRGFTIMEATTPRDLPKKKKSKKKSKK